MGKLPQQTVIAINKGQTKNGKKTISKENSTLEAKKLETKTPKLKLSETLQRIQK